MAKRSSKSGSQRKRKQQSKAASSQKGGQRSTASGAAKTGQRSRPAASARSASRGKGGSRGSRRSATMVFSNRNYVLLLIGVVLIVVGYTMMRLENEVDGFISLYVAPLLILGGYLEIIYAILWRPKEKTKTAKETAA